MPPLALASTSVVRKSILSISRSRPLLLSTSSQRCLSSRISQGRSHFGANGDHTGSGSGSSKGASGPGGPNGRRGVSTMALLSILSVSLPTTYLLSSFYPAHNVLPAVLPAPLDLLFPAPSPPPASLTSPEGKALMARLEAEVLELDIVKDMKEKKGWYITRPHSETSPSPHNLTASVLHGPGKLGVRPVVFAREDESEGLVVLHLGRSLCGHDGIIHGGLIATIFDESLARNALLNLPSKIGVTATLSLNYRKPTRADQWVIIRTKLDKLDGRKADVSASMETLDGEVLCLANGLFVEPKWAKYLSNSGVGAALGKKPSGLDTCGDGNDEVGRRPK